MALYELYFWQNWPVKRQKSFFQLMVLAWAALLVLICFSVSMSGEKSLDRAERMKKSYEKAAPLVAEYMSLKGNRGALTDMGPMATAQQITRDLGLEKKLSSVRPMDLDAGSQGVQLIFDGLDLPQILAFMKEIKIKGGLKVLTFSLTHKLDNDRLANLQMVLTR